MKFLFLFAKIQIFYKQGCSIQPHFSNQHVKSGFFYTNRYNYMAQVKAKKYLGQHFLKDMEIARQIADSLVLDGRTSVLEIGPGMGVLTQFLLQNPLIDLTAVELDGESVEYLHKHYPDLKVIEADFLKMDLKSYFPEKFCIIGNFPYNISSPILFKVLEWEPFTDQVRG